MTDPEPTLNAEQLQVLQAIYDKLRELGRWPSFDQIDRPLRRAGLDPLRILRTIPESLDVSSRPGRGQPRPKDRIHLKIQGIALCDGGAADVDYFLRLLRWFAEKELNFDAASEGEESSPVVTSAEVKEYLQLADDADTVLSRLFEILNTEHWGFRSSSRSTAGDDWTVTIGRDVSRFADVQSVADYLAAHNAWENEGNAFIITDDFYSPGYEFEYGQRQTPADTYVAASIVAVIQERAAEAPWNCGKLLQLIQELNDNYASGSAYSAHAMLRAILDHIPPMLGHDTFQQVMSNYPWGRTDKAYVKKLLDFKLQADDVLHRTISTKQDLLSIDDMPLRACINRLLQECAERCEPGI